MDVVDSLPRSSKGNEYIDNLLELAIRYVDGVAVTKITAKIICSVLSDFSLRLASQLNYRLMELHILYVRNFNLFV